ncbi:MAG: DNA methyltransferase [Bacteroidetes bacterium]|nr:DNA methyltransferase [Bacteroidota bacterium]
MRGINSQTVDLVYLDPPFNSKVNYAAPIGSAAAGAAFKDTWSLDDLDLEWIREIQFHEPSLYRVINAAMTDSDKSYLVYMAIRLLEMRRILKLTGSIYLHCDPTMSHYLKLVMDAIFGRMNFRNEIAWQRDAAGKGGKKKSGQWPRLHDALLLYSMSDSWMFRQAFTELTHKQQKAYRYTEKESGRLYKSVQLGNYSDISISHMKKEGLIHKSSSGKLYKKYYLDEAKSTVGSIWSDIPGFGVRTSAKERTGYPTQKPLALLSRIIEASTNTGDIVFDPFCGCATTCVAADALGREWIGIDISEKAYELVNIRLRENQGARFYEDGSKQSSILENVIHRKDIPQRTDLGKIPIYNCTENKRKLFGDQEGKCNWCKIAFAIQNLDVDHIVAKSKGGTDHIDNLQLLCSHCNRVKGDRGMEYMKKLHSHLKLAA